ncbi:hypothetical protein [Mesorhizobium sp. CAU 1741]|uniref:hypothetical protein n=1 Tax=Mesorhizobium sp. CAU 1741 TaxID=3140366 RepID=UPI00325C22B7
MNEDHPFIAALRAEAARCEEAETEFRRTMNARLAALTQARAFANRRMNLMRSMLDVVTRCEDRDVAVASALSVLRGRLGWRDDSPARDDVLSEYAKLAGAGFDATHQPEAPAEASAEPVDVGEALEAFEQWYVGARGKPFWVLFEHYMPETQLVDF